MTDWHPLSERERAIATVAGCELQLRRAHTSVSVAGEALRRAARDVENAKAELGNATRRLTRMELPMTKAG